jgi:hypothetical protein
LKVWARKDIRVDVDVLDDLIVSHDDIDADQGLMTLSVTSSRNGIKLVIGQLDRAHKHFIGHVVPSIA